MCGNWISLNLDHLYKWCHNTTELEQLQFSAKVLVHYVSLQENILFGERVLHESQHTKVLTSHPTPRLYATLANIDGSFKAMFHKIRMDFLNDRQKQAYCHFYMLRILRKMEQEDLKEDYTMEEYGRLIDYLLKISHSGHLVFQLRI